MTWIERLFESENLAAANAPAESPIHSVASKAAYVRRTRKRMASIHARFQSVQSEISNGVAVGRLKDDVRLDQLQRKASTCQADVETIVTALRKSDFNQWAKLESAVESSIDAYRHAVKKLDALTKTADH